MACKLFHDGVYLIAKAEEHPKFFQDRLPAMAHKCYKKKQWRKQFFEAARRVCCRLARGLGLHTNCLAEDAFVLMILADAFNLGWRRVGEFVDHLPETDKDRDWDRVARTAGNDDIASLLRGRCVRALFLSKTLTSTCSYFFPPLPPPPPQVTCRPRRAAAAARTAPT